MGHHHNHDHSKDMPSNRLGWAFVLNFVFTIIEFIGGFLTNSTAILADAVHDLGDSLSLGLAWVLNKLGKNRLTNTLPTVISDSILPVHLLMPLF